jgi:hypothetical protein
MAFLRFALRSLARDVKSGELAVLVLALLVAVGSLTAVAFFTSRIGRAVEQQAGSVLAAAGLAWIGFAGRQAQIAPLALSMFANGLGVGLFQVAYFDLVAAALPRGHRGVAGSLAMATRTIGVVAGATLLMFVFQSFGATATAAGASPRDAFLAGMHGVFRLAAVVPLVPVALGLLFSRSRRAPGC